MNARFLDVLHDAADHHRAGGIGHGVDVELEGILEELVDQNRMLERGVDGLDHVAIERAAVVDDGHRAAAEYIRGAHDNRKADGRGRVARLAARRRRAARRLRNLQLGQQTGEPFAVFGQIDGVG